MRWPWVSRATYERSEQNLHRADGATTALQLSLSIERARVDHLIDVIVKLKRLRFESLESRKPIQPADTDGDALRRAETHKLRHREVAFIKNATADLVNQGHDVVTAEKEARRLYEQATDLHPEG